MPAIDLSHELVLLEDGIEKALPTGEVETGDLPRRRGEPVVAAQLEKVEFGDRVRATSAVECRLQNECSASRSSHLPNHCEHLIDGDQALLKHRRDKRACTFV